MLEVEHGLKLWLDIIKVLVEGLITPLFIETKKLTKELQMETTTKICKTCKKNKTLDNFHRYKQAKDGHRYECKLCRKIDGQEYQIKNKKEIAIRKKQYCSLNQEKIKEAGKLYRENNAEIIKNKKKIYASKNKDKISKQQKIWKAKNKEHIAKQAKIYASSSHGKQAMKIIKQKRRALKHTTEDGTITKESLNQLRELQNNKCYICKIELNFKEKNQVHLDHHIPISKSGKHSIENVVYLCKRCNLIKAAKIPKTLLLI